MTEQLYAELKKELSESFSLTDNYTKEWALSRTYSESFGVSDSWSGGKLISEEYAESLSLSDVKTKQIIKLLSESNSLSDSNINYPTKNLTESFSLGDSKIFSIVKLLSEGFSFVDDVVGTKKIFRIFSESVSLSDSEWSDITKSLSESFSLSDGDITVVHEIVLEEEFGFSDIVGRFNYDGLGVASARLDIQKIIKTHGMQAELVRETEDTESMGDTKTLGVAGYTIFFMMQDISKKDRQIHEMGLAIPGNVKGFFYNEYPNSITGNGTLTVRAGDKIKDKNGFWWRIEQIVGARKMKFKEIFRSAVLKKIDLTQ